MRLGEVNVGPSGNALCAPFIIYVVIVVVGTLSSVVNYATSGKDASGKPITLTSILIGIMINLMIGGLIYYLCSVGRESAAWFVLLIPLISVAFVLLIVVGAVAGMATVAH